MELPHGLVKLERHEAEQISQSDIFMLTQFVPGRLVVPVTVVEEYEDLTVKHMLPATTSSPRLSWLRSLSLCLTVRCSSSSHTLFIPHEVGHAPPKQIRSQLRV